MCKWRGWEASGLFLEGGRKASARPQTCFSCARRDRGEKESTELDYKVIVLGEKKGFSVQGKRLLGGSLLQISNKNEQEKDKESCN